MLKLPAELLKNVSDPEEHTCTCQCHFIKKKYEPFNINWIAIKYLAEDKK